MKQVFSNSELPHVWAHQQQETGRTPNGSFYFDGATIYSYGAHFPIAKHQLNKDGEKCILFTTGKYSNTTARHISRVWQAIPAYGNKIIHVPEIYGHNGLNVENELIETGRNYTAWKKQIEAQAQLLIKARKKEKYLNAIDSIANEVKVFTSFFGFDIPADLQTLMSIGSAEEYKAYAEKKETERLQAEKEREARLQKEHVKALQEWRKGKGQRLSVHNGFDYLRIEDKRLRTSQGMEIPFEAAKRLFQKIKNGLICEGNCGEFMQYSIKEITKEHIIIGCHKITIRECKAIGKKLNW